MPPDTRSQGLLDAAIDTYLNDAAVIAFESFVSHEASRVAHDHYEGMLGMLPVLRTGEAIVTGEAVPLPMRVLVPEPPSHQLPDSRDARVVSENPAEGWNHTRESNDYTQIVAVWRSQDSKPRGSVTNNRLDTSEDD